MIKIAESEGVEVYGYERGFFSFANSPYYAHKRLSAVDVYPPRGEREALSPVDGRVRFVKGISSGDDYAIIVEPEDEPNVCVKILHVKPRSSLKPRDRINVGCCLGEIVWSPFYNFWTDLHMHVEVRPAIDPLRARGSFEMKVEALTERMAFPSTQEDKEPVFRVEEVRDRYALLRGFENFPSLSSPIKLDFEGFTGYLEGGVPQYGHCAVIGRGKEPEEKHLNILGVKAALDYSRKGYLHFNYKKVKVTVNDEPYRGLSIYINEEYLKLVPLRVGEINLKEGDEAIIKLG